MGVRLLTLVRSFFFSFCHIPCCHFLCSLEYSFGFWLASQIVHKCCVLLHMSFELIYYWGIKTDYRTVDLGLYVQREAKSQKGKSKGRKIRSTKYTRKSWRPKSQLKRPGIDGLKTTVLPP
jgi:hypothetical protein